MRHLLGRLDGWLLIAFWLLAGPAWGQAPAPDPITFEYAIERGDLRKVKGWLDEGLNPEYQAAHIGSGLMVAAWYGHVELMALFVERGADVRRSNRNGEQALQLAAWGGHQEAVKWLLEHGAPLDRQGNQWGALHYAVFNGHAQVVADLMARGANVNARSPNGSTPLMMAAREGRDALARVLLEAGANSRLQSDWGDTALTMAMRYDHLRLAKMIASPEEFDIAVKAPKESLGEESRSASVPPEIEELMRQIRAAEAEGRPSEDLHKKLLAAVNAMRRASAAPAVQRPMPRPYQPRSMVITARRGQPGAERAQLMVDGKPAGQAVASPAPSPSSATAVKAAIPGTPAKARNLAAAQASDLLRQIRLAEAQGRPADALRQQLYQAVEAMKP
ncbi:ankyrin repeat domain-containing protein [Candidatus Accumulibacter aalborgensis]|uniref:ankyrin repeat domain-containing protein n=1 Tax=Candidatus Accumulibacter aalborgensis TaxID=1860102 RepID=UPI00164415DA|nr:ankyrin repeat domain-containing protein [Candidatus Accumulibacter aalborgensis]